MVFEDNLFYQRQREIITATRELALSIDPIFFATAAFNDFASLQRGYDALKFFHSKLDRKLLGKHYYKQPRKNRTLFLAFPEHIESNLHYHLVIARPHLNEQRVLNLAPVVWQKVCRMGDLKIDSLKENDDVRATSFYSTKDVFKEQSYENFIISTQFLT